MDKIITLLFCRRPRYAEIVLEHLRACEGIENYKLIINVDGPPIPEMKKVCSSILFAPTDVHYSDINLGCNHSTRAVLRRGFNESDYVIHVEEDVILAPDSLRFFEWARQFVTDQTIFNVAALKIPKASAAPKFNTEGNVEKDWSFHCWGWSTWKDRWMEMDKNWSNKDDMNLSWDVHLNDVRSWRNGCELMPHVSRSMNIGKEGGLHCGEFLLPYWAGSPGFKSPIEYCLIT